MVLVSRPRFCAAALRCISCSFVVALPGFRGEGGGCTIVPVVVVAAAAALCLGVYGRYLGAPLALLSLPGGEAADASPGDNSGCAS